MSYINKNCYKEAKIFFSVGCIGEYRFTEKNNVAKSVLDFSLFFNVIEDFGNLLFVVDFRANQ